MMGGKSQIGDASYRGTFDVAVHESAHALAVHLYGGEIDFVTIDGQPVCRMLDPLPPLAGLVCAAIGEAAQDRFWHFADHVSVEGATRICESLTFPAEPGDQTAMAINAHRMMSLQPDTGHLMAPSNYCRGIKTARDLISRPASWRAVVALSECLIRRRRIGGTAAHILLSEHFAHGAMAADGAGDFPPCFPE